MVKRLLFLGLISFGLFSNSFGAAAAPPRDNGQETQKLMINEIEFPQIIIDHSPFLQAMLSGRHAKKTTDFSRLEGLDLAGGYRKYSADVKCGREKLRLPLLEELGQQLYLKTLFHVEQLIKMGKYFSIDYLNNEEVIALIQFVNYYGVSPLEGDQEDYLLLLFERIILKRDARLYVLLIESRLMGLFNLEFLNRLIRKIAVRKIKESGFEETLEGNCASSFRRILKESHEEVANSLTNLQHFDDRLVVEHFPNAEGQTTNHRLIARIRDMGLDESLCGHTLSDYREMLSSWEYGRLLSNRIFLQLFDNAGGLYPRRSSNHNSIKLFKLYLSSISKKEIMEIVTPLLPHNDIHGDDFNSFLVNVGEVCICHNRITELEEGFLSSFPNAYDLMMEHNRLTRLSQRDLQGVQHLSSINIENNMITEIDEGAFVEQESPLLHINFSNNPLQVLTGNHFHGSFTQQDLNNICGGTQYVTQERGQEEAFIDLINRSSQRAQELIGASNQQERERLSSESMRDNMRLYNRTIFGKMRAILSMLRIMLPSQTLLDRRLNPNADIWGGRLTLYERWKKLIRDTTLSKTRTVLFYFFGFIPELLTLAYANKLKVKEGPILLFLQFMTIGKIFPGCALLIQTMLMKCERSLTRTTDPLFDCEVYHYYNIDFLLGLRSKLLLCALVFCNINPRLNKMIFSRFGEGEVSLVLFTAMLKLLVNDMDNYPPHPQDLPR